MGQEAHVHLSASTPHTKTNTAQKCSALAMLASLFLAEQDNNASHLKGMCVCVCVYLREPQCTAVCGGTVAEPRSAPSGGVSPGGEGAAGEAGWPPCAGLRSDRSRLNPAGRIFFFKSTIETKGPLFYHQLPPLQMERLPRCMINQPPADPVDCTNR